MKYLIVLFSLCSLNAFSQVNPTLSTDGFTPFWTNPAATGSWNKFSANATYQNQWPSLSENNQTINISSEWDLMWGGKASKNGFNMPVGLNAMHQSNGTQRILNVNLPISVPIKIGETSLALGLAPGIHKVTTDLTQIVVGDPSPIAASVNAFDLNAGAFWYSERHYAGFSITNATQPEIDGFQTARSFNAQGGYRFKIGKHYLFPMVSASSIDGFFNLRAINYFQFKEDVFSVGLGYGSGSNITLAATVRVKAFKFAYNYTRTLSKLTNGFGSTHEVRLSYAIPKLFGKNIQE
jgi:type IX secretion system PorP/SprF family membrane protein